MVEEAGLPYGVLQLLTGPNTELTTGGALHSLGV